MIEKITNKIEELKIDKKIYEEYINLFIDNKKIEEILKEDEEYLKLKEQNNEEY